MARPSWNGTISFGLVSIPVSLYSATRSEAEKISFHLLHAKDMGRVGNQRVCKLDGKQLSPDEIVKGYEVAKDEYVVITDEDIKTAEESIETSRTIQISDFVDESEIDPRYFEEPYYIVPGKNADHVYVLLREALKKTKKVGIAKLAFRSREHLAAIKAEGRAIVLETMHFAAELTPIEDLGLPSEESKVGAKELSMAEQLIGMMASEFEPEKYKDSYREAMLAVIEKKSKGKEIKPSAKKPAASTNVVDIMSKLKASLEATSSARKTTAARSSSSRKRSKTSRAA